MSEMRELIDTELDAVCGGGFSFSDSFNRVRQTQSAWQIGVALGGSSVFGNGGNATNTQSITQTQSSTI
jgi:hypothetical protein